MAADANTENDVVLSDVHVCLSNSENTDQGLDPQTKPTWLSRLYFRLPQNYMTASQLLEKFKPGSLDCKFGNYSSTATSYTERTCGSLEKSLPQLDDDGDCVLLRRVSQKLFQNDSKSSFQHQISSVSPEIDHTPRVLLTECETTTCCVEIDLPDLDVSESRTIMRGSMGNLLSDVSEMTDDANLPHEIDYNTEDLSVYDSVHGSLENNLIESDENGDVILKRRQANTLFQNAFQVDNDNKKVLKLPQESDSSIDMLSTDKKCVNSVLSTDKKCDISVLSTDKKCVNSVLSTDKKCVNSTSRCDQLFNCCTNSGRRTGNKLLKSHSRIFNSDTSKDASIEQREIFLEQPDTLEQNVTSSSSSDDHFSVSDIKTNDKIPTDEQSQNEEVIYGVLTLEHSMGTSIPEVGYQVWSGALLLCDYLIDNCADLEQAIVLDLGTGTGIAAIVAAMFAPQVVSTDYLPGVLGLAKRNWERNKDLLPLRACDQVSFKILDWTRDWRSSDSVPESKYALTSSDLGLVEDARLILAAEAIYDDELTDGLFTTIYNLLMQPPCKSVVLTVERRVMFSVHNKDICSPAYEHFLENVEDLVTVDEGPIRFTAKKLDTGFPQFFHYQRVKELKHSLPFARKHTTEAEADETLTWKELLPHPKDLKTPADKARPMNDLSSGRKRKLHMFCVGG